MEDPMKTPVGIAITLAAAVLSSVAHADTVNFDSFDTGAPPPGWTATQTGSGAAKWTVERDDTAPSKPNVLKQSGRATFPICIKDDTSIRDGFVEEVSFGGPKTPTTTTSRVPMLSKTTSPSFFLMMGRPPRRKGRTRK